jgi:hypothetical protein
MRLQRPAITLHGRGGFTRLQTRTDDQTPSKKKAGQTFGLETADQAQQNIGRFHESPKKPAMMIADCFLIIR